MATLTTSWLADETEKAIHVSFSVARAGSTHELDTVLRRCSPSVSRETALHLEPGCESLRHERRCAGAGTKPTPDQEWGQ